MSDIMRFRLLLMKIHYYSAAKRKITKWAFPWDFFGKFLSVRGFFFQRNQKANISVISPEFVSVYIYDSFLTIFLWISIRTNFFFCRNQETNNHKNFSRPGLCVDSCWFFYLFISHFCIAGFFAFPTDFHFLVADFCIQDDVHSPSITIRLFFS